MLASQCGDAAMLPMILGIAITRTYGIEYRFDRVFCSLFGDKIFGALPSVCGAETRTIDSGRRSRVLSTTLSHNRLH